MADLATDAAWHSNRLLAEVVCALEEAELRPREAQAAEAAARAAGGDFARRILTRAASLDDAPALRGLIGRARGSLRGAAFVLWVVSAIAGALAALSVGAGRTINVPLALLLVVGLNLVMLAAWLLAQFAYRSVAHASRAVFARLSGVVARVRGPVDGRAAAIAGVLVSGAHGRWLVGCSLHAAWLVYTGSALLVLAVLLGFTSYEVSWQTTLFDEATLLRVARALDAVPSLIGLSADDIWSAGRGAAANRAWGWWLLCAIVAYGAVPRAVALALSIVLLWRARRRFGTDLSRPGYARLRHRLMPETAGLGVVDAAPPDDAAAGGGADAAPLAGFVHGLWLEGADGDAPPPFPGVTWRWLGNVDSAESRRALLERLRGDHSIATLAVVVRAAATPDRGIERALTEIRAATPAPVRLLLARLDQLEARGPSAMAGRIADWRAMAGRAHVACVAPTVHAGSAA